MYGNQHIQGLGMSKEARISRTFRLPLSMSLQFDSICKRHGDATWHTEQAFAAYFESLAPHADTPPPKPKKAAKKFTKPEVIELQHYFHERGSPTCVDDAQAFFDHFTSNGWKVGGKGAMKCWKAAVRNWMRGNKNEAAKQSNRKSHTARAVDHAQQIFAQCDAEEADQRSMDSHDSALPRLVGESRG